MSTEPELAVPPRVDTARCSVGTASRRDDRAADRQPAHGVPRPLTWPRRYRSSALGDDSLQRHSSPSTPPGPMRPFTSAEVIALRRQLWRACSLRIFSRLPPDILPPISFSRSSRTLYSY